MLIDSDSIDMNKINRIYVIVGGNHGQGAFQFPIQMLYIMNRDRRHESIQPVGYILCKHNNGDILKKYDYEGYWRFS